LTESIPRSVRPRLPLPSTRLPAVCSAKKQLQRKTV
jgi:hypothetical protein